MPARREEYAGTGGVSVPPEAGCAGSSPKKSWSQWHPVGTRVAGSGRCLDETFSVELQSDRLDDRRPFRNFLLEQATGLVRIRIEVGLETRRDEHPLQLAVGHRLARGLRNLLDDLLRRAARREQADEL